MFAAAPPVQPADEIVEDMLERSLQRVARGGFRAIRSVRLCACRGALRAQPQLLDLWRLPRHWRRRARQDFRCRRANWSCAPSRRASRAATWPRIRRRCMRKPIAVRDLPFEFAMNGFRLVEGFDDELFDGQHGPADWRPGAGAGAAGGPRAGGTRARTWRATPKGFRFLNEILVALLPETEAVPRDLAQGASTLGVFMHRRPCRDAQTRGLRQVSVLLHDKCHVIILIYMALMQWSLFDQGNSFAFLAAVFGREGRPTHRVIHTFCG